MINRIVGSSKGITVDDMIDYAQHSDARTIKSFLTKTFDRMSGAKADEVEKSLMDVLDPSKIDDPEAVAREIVQMFLVSNKKSLESFYKIEIGNNEFDKIVEEIGKVRKMLKKGGKVDKRRVYITMINDWQKGKLLLKPMKK